MIGSWWGQSGRHLEDISIERASMMRLKLCRIGVVGVGVVFVAAAAIVGCGVLTPPAPTQSQAGTTTTIVLVRHAERDPGLDPPLNAVGVVRAQAL